jgi:hypothetical protein
VHFIKGPLDGVYTHVEDPSRRAQTHEPPVFQTLTRYEPRDNRDSSKGKEVRRHLYKLDGPSAPDKSQPDKIVWVYEYQGF